MKVGKCPSDDSFEMLWGLLLETKFQKSSSINEEVYVERLDNEPFRIRLSLWKSIEKLGTISGKPNAHVN